MMLTNLIKKYFAWKNFVILALVIFCLKFVLVFQGADFRWIGLSIFADLAFPLLSIFAFSFSLNEMNSILLKTYVRVLAIALIVMIVSLYLIFQPFPSAQYLFVSPEKKNILVVTERSYLLSGSIALFKTKFVFIKKRVGRERNVDDGFQPFLEGYYSVNWSNDEDTCFVNWAVDPNSNRWVRNEVVVYDSK